MKDLTHDELLKAPDKVQYLYTMSAMGHPVDYQVVEDAIKESPEYFPDEIEHRRRWDLIPQFVHDEYWAERDQLTRDCYKDMPPSKGIIAWVRGDDNDGFKKWNDTYKKFREIEIPLAEAIHKKYYDKYGIEFNGL